MQKRRPHNVGLPLTDADIHVPSSVHKKSFRTRKRTIQNGGSAQTLVFAIALVLILGVALMGFNFGSGSRGRESRRIEQMDLRLPLSQYVSLEYALQNSKLVGLYFAASWCPLSTPVSEMIDKALGEMLLPPPSSDRSPPTDRAPMSIVYVSSDRNEEDFLEYSRWNWISVPFDSSEKTALKKHFSVCSSPEAVQLGIDRKFEIPTLLILDGATHGVVSTNGAEDLLEYKHNAFDHWMDLLHLIRAMEEKYGSEEHGSITPKKRRVDHADSLSSLFA